MESCEIPHDTPRGRAFPGRIFPRLTEMRWRPRPATPEAGAPPRFGWRSGPTALLLAAQIAAGLAIAATTGTLILHAREQTLLQAALEQQRFSRILADQAERAFEAVELVQTTLVEQSGRDGPQTADEFR